MTVKTCRKHNLPRVWGKMKGNELRTYCTRCMDEQWEKEFAKEREERKRFAYLIPFEQWLLENYSYRSAMWRLQIARKVHKDFDRPISEVSHKELDRRYTHPWQKKHRFYSMVKKCYEWFLELEDKGDKNGK